MLGPRPPATPSPSSSPLPATARSNPALPAVASAMDLKPLPLGLLAEPPDMLLGTRVVKRRDLGSSPSSAHLSASSSSAPSRSLSPSPTSSPTSLSSPRSPLPSLSFSLSAPKSPKSSPHRLRLRDSAAGGSSPVLSGLGSRAVRCRGGPVAAAALPATAGAPTCSSSASSGRSSPAPRGVGSQSEWSLAAAPPWAENEEELLTPLPVSSGGLGSLHTAEDAETPLASPDSLLVLSPPWARHSVRRDPTRLGLSSPGCCESSRDAADPGCSKFADRGTATAALRSLVPSLGSARFDSGSDEDEDDGVAVRGYRLIGDCEPDTAEAEVAWHSSDGVAKSNVSRTTQRIAESSRSSWDDLDVWAKRAQPPAIGVRGPAVDSPSSRDVARVVRAVPDTNRADSDDADVVALAPLSGVDRRRRPSGGSAVGQLLQPQQQQQWRSSGGSGGLTFAVAGAGGEGRVAEVASCSRHAVLSPAVVDLLERVRRHSDGEVAGQRASRGAAGWAGSRDMGCERAGEGASAVVGAASAAAASAGRKGQWHGGTPGSSNNISSGSSNRSTGSSISSGRADPGNAGRREVIVEDLHGGMPPWCSRPATKVKAAAAATAPAAAAAAQTHMDAPSYTGSGQRQGQHQAATDLQRQHPHSGAGARVVGVGPMSSLGARPSTAPGCVGMDDELNPAIEGSQRGRTAAGAEAWLVGRWLAGWVGSGQAASVV